ncbi:MAG TPA: hypothetical protein VGE63_00635 [Candidatus Paceibacterota bacterium]
MKIIKISERLNRQKEQLKTNAQQIALLLQKELGTEVKTTYPFGVARFRIEKEKARAFLDLYATGSIVYCLQFKKTIIYPRPTLTASDKNTLDLTNTQEIEKLLTLLKEHFRGED